MATPTPQLSADDIPTMIESAEFKAMPLAERQRISELALEAGAAGLAGSWDREKYQQWGQFAEKVRGTVAESESMGEKVAWAGRTAGGAIKDSLATAGTLALGVSPVIPDGRGGAAWQVPGETLGPMMATSMAGLVTGQLQPGVKPVQGALVELKAAIDDGEFFDHKGGMAGWLDEAQGKLAKVTAPYYRDGETGTDWASENGLMAPENARLLQAYLTTRSPEAWTALQKNVERTPTMAQIGETKRALREESTLGKALAPEARAYIEEAADPAEVIPGMFAVKQGVKAAQRGVRAVDRAKELAKGVAAEVGSEQVSAMMDDPNLSWGERAEIAKQSLVASLGLMAPGAGLRAGVNLMQGGKTNGLPGNETTVPAGAGGNPFAGPIEAPPQPEEAGGAAGGGFVPGPMPGFQDDPFATPVTPAPNFNVVRDFGLPRTEAAQAGVNQAEQDYQSSLAKAQGQLNKSLRRMPLIPDNPLGYRDLLDFVNDNPLHIPRAGSEAAKAGEYDWVGGYSMPNYYRRFLATSEGGHNASDLAAMAFDEGYIQQPTPDALIEQIDKTIRERTQYKVEFRRQQQEMKQAETRVQNFEKDQQKPRSNGQRLALEFLAPGDQFRIGEEDVVVRHVEYDQDGAPTEVVIEDGKRYGIMSLDPQTRGAILVDGFTPRESQGAGSMQPGLEAQEETPFMPRKALPGVRGEAANAAAVASGQVGAPIPAGMRGLMGQGTAAAPAPGAGTAGKGLGKLFNAGGVSAAAPVQVAAPDLAGAYAAAAKGSSTQMLPISRVFEEARAVDATLTPEAFLEAVKAAYDAGGVYLESYDSPDGLRRAGQFVVQDAMGVPATGMMIVQAEEVLGMAANAATVAGPLPSTYSGAAPMMPAVQTPWSGKVRTLHGMRKFLLEAVGLPAVGVGRFGQKALGIYKTKPEAVRLQAINDIPVLAHEVGHHIHYRLLSAVRGTADAWNGQYDGELVPLGRPTSGTNYTRDQVRKEGVAEFTRLWLTDPVTARAKAPVFSQFWEQTLETKAPEAAVALREAQGMISDYVAMPAFEKAKAQIVFDPAKEQKRAPLGTFLREVYARFVNTLQPALDVVREAANMDPTLEGKARDVEAWMENHRGGWASKAGQDVFGMQTDLHGNVMGPGLQMILKDLSPGENQDFSAYLALKRAQELEGRGKRSGFEQARLPAAEMQVLEGRFEKMRQGLIKWLRGQRDLLVQAGLLDSRSAQAMDDANADYVPFYRLYETLNNVSLGPESSKNAGGYVDLQSGIRQLKGSDRAIIDPLQSAMKNASMFRKLAEQNLIGVKFFDLVREVQGGGKWGETIKPKTKVTETRHDDIVKKLIEQGVIQDESDLPTNADLTLRMYQAITKPDTKNGEVIIFKNGKREHWEVKDALLMAALKSADADAVKLGAIPHWLMKVLTAPTKVLRWGATGGPWFALPNLIRDNVQAGVLSQSGRSGVGGYVPFLDAIRGGKEILRKGGDFERWKQMGGEFSGLVTGTQAFTRMLDDVLPKDPVAKRAAQGLFDPKAWGAGLGKALDLIGAFGKFTEQATRVGEFMRAKKAGKSEMEAANLSKVVSLNFARAGEVSRVLNQFIPFFNATVQSLDQLWRAHTDPKMRGAVMMKGLMYITLPSLITWALGKDDEEIQNLPEWRKNLAWNINLKPLAAALGMPEAGFILSLPKPFLLGAIYGTSVERLLDYATGRDPNGARKAAENILANTLNPFEVVTGVAGMRPLIEAETNKSLFTGMEIVPKAYQNLPPEQQYSVLTSETAKAVGRWTGQSPMMIDHLIRGYFATAGRFGTDAIDYGMAKLGLADVPPPPRKGWMELPVLNRFSGSPYQANAFVTRFYNVVNEMEGKLAVFNKQAPQMTTAEQQKWWQANKEEMGWYLRVVNGATGLTGAGEVRKARAALSEINGAMKNIQASREMTGGDKRARLLELARQRNEMAERAFKALFPVDVQRRHY